MRDFVRAYVIADDDRTTAGRADGVAGLALDDHGLSITGATVDVTCSTTPCPTPGAEIAVRVAAEVVRPGTDVLGPDGLSFTVAADHRGVVDTLREAPLRKHVRWATTAVGPGLVGTARAQVTLARTMSDRRGSRSMNDGHGIGGLGTTTARCSSSASGPMFSRSPSR